MNGPFSLYRTFYADRVFAQYRCDTGENARLIEAGNAQIVCGLRLLDAQHLALDPAHFEVDRVAPRDRNEVGDYGRCRRPRAGASAVVQGRSCGVAVHEHGVHDIVDVGKRVVFRYQTRVYTGFDAIDARASDTEMFNRIA